MGIVAQIRDPCLDTGSCADLSVIRRTDVPAVYLSPRISEHPLIVIQAIQLSATCVKLRPRSPGRLFIDVIVGLLSM